MREVTLAGDTDNKKIVSNISVKEHSWDAGEITKEPTCVGTGTMTYICKTCGKTKEETLDAAGHTWEKEYTVDKEATCEEEGSQSYHCSRCGIIDEESIKKISALGHDYKEEWTVDKAVTCDEAGNRSHHCSRCDAIDEKSKEEISPIGHAYDKGKVTKEATCTAKGVRIYTCEVCKGIKKEEIPALGHDLSDEWVADEDVLCLWTVYEYRSCQRCSYRDSRVKGTKDHEWEEGVILYEPTCTEDGMKATYCKKCGSYYDGKTISAAGHSYITSVTKATFSKNGRKEEKCNRCGETKSSQVIYYPKTISLSKTSYTYNGKVQTPSVTVKDSNGKKVSASNHTISYAKGRKAIGGYSVKITFKGNYSGSITKNYTIAPKGTSISNVSAGKKAFTVKWKKQTSQTSGYQIQYSTSNNFKSGTKTVTISKNKATSKKISKLKAKKKYYVRVRSYKTVKINGKTTKIYSGWSKAKSAKTK